MPWSICGSANGYSLFHAEYYFLNVATWPFHTLGCNYVIKQQSLTENVACFWMPQWNTSSAVKHLCLLEEAWARAHPATDGAAEIWWQNSPKQAVIMVLEWGRVLYKFVNQQNFNICVWWAGPDTGWPHWVCFVVTISVKTLGLGPLLLQQHPSFGGSFVTQLFERVNKSKTWGSHVHGAGKVLWRTMSLNRDCSALPTDCNFGGAHLLPAFSSWNGNVILLIHVLVENNLQRNSWLDKMSLAPLLSVGSVCTFLLPASQRNTNSV